MISRLCDLAFLRDPRIREDVRPLHLLIQSSLCSEARDIIAQFIDTSLALPLSKAFGFENPGRAHFQLLSRQGLSITTLARRSGIHRTQLSTLCNKSDPNPCLLTVQRIVAVLNAETEVNLVQLEQGRAALGGTES